MGSRRWLALGWSWAPDEKGDTFTVASVVSKGKDDEYVNGSLHVSVYKVAKDGERITKLVSKSAQYGEKVTHKELLTPKAK